MTAICNRQLNDGTPMRPAKISEKVYQYLRRGMETGRFRVAEKIPTERDLATQFGTSRPTVTRAIHRLVAEKLIRRQGKGGSTVIALPERQPLVFGAAMLGLAVHHREETTVNRVAREMAHLAGLEKVEILFEDPSWSEDPGEAGVANQFRAVARTFIARRVSGVFLTPQEILADQFVSPTVAIAQNFEEAGIPLVFLDRDLVRHPARTSTDWVGIDNLGAGYMLARHFLELGCRRIDFLGHFTRVPTQESRIDGYLRAMELHGLHPDPGSVVHGNLFDPEFVIQTIRRRRPQAVLVVSDSRAAAVQRFSLQAGIRIPEDLRIGSFDDLPICTQLPVPLTTIRQPVAAIAAVALRSMFHRLDNPGAPAVHCELNGELIVRKSSGRPVLAAGVNPPRK